MIIDECLLVLVHSQAEPPPSRPTARSKIAATKRAMKMPPAPPPQAAAPHLAMHSIDELSIIGCIDAMPAMQSTKRIRAPTTMAARPRLGRARAIPEVPRPHRAPSSASLIPRPRARSAKSAEPPKQRTARREAPPSRTRTPAVAVTPLSIISSLDTPDEKMKAVALELASADISSEPVLPIHTAIRVVMQASLNLGRPYDTNMLAATMGVTRSLVMQSLRKHYEDFAEQSQFTEVDFIPTYLWLYGLDDEPARVHAVTRAITLSGAGEPGSRSVFAIARDFVILYVTEVVHGVNGGGLASASTVINGLRAPEDVPRCFLEMTNSFLYRARMTGRTVLKAKPHLGGGTIAGLFAPDEE